MSPGCGLAADAVVAGSGAGAAVVTNGGRNSISAGAVILLSGDAAAQVTGLIVSVEFGTFMALGAITAIFQIGMATNNRVTVMGTDYSRSMACIPDQWRVAVTLITGGAGRVHEGRGLIVGMTGGAVT